MCALDNRVNKYYSKYILLFINYKLYLISNFLFFLSTERTARYFTWMLVTGILIVFKIQS